MKSIAPDIYRQRLLIEGYFEIKMSRETVEQYLLGLVAHLGLRTYGEPVVFSPAGSGKIENEGFDAFIPLVDSGISAYIWTSQRFFSVLIYTCKAFDEAAAIEFTTQFFDVRSEIVHHAF
jgi:hypothetical protein